MNDLLSFQETEEPVVSVVIIAWQSAPHLADCLRALLANVTDTAYEIILILNEPNDDLVAYVATQTSGIKTITTRVNVGYGGAVNLGVSRAKGEFIVLLNDDTEVLTGWLEPLVATARRRPRAAAVGSTTLFPDGRIQEAGSVIWADGTTMKVGRDLPRGTKTFDYERKVDHCSGTSLLVRKKSWEAIGGMDAEAFFPAYYEDTDLCLRLIERGEEVWYQPRSYICHLESASTNSSYRSFLFERNGAVFYERWADKLNNHVVPVDRGEGQISEAVWRAMGSPFRVCVIDEQPLTHLGLYGELQADGSCHLTVYCPLSIVDNDELCAMGIGVVVPSDHARFDEPFFRSDFSYDVVFVVQPGRYQDTLVALQSAAEDIPVVTFEDGAPSTDKLTCNKHTPIGTGDEPMSWSSLIHQLKLRSARDNVDEVSERYRKADD